MYLRQEFHKFILIQSLRLTQLPYILYLHYVAKSRVLVLKEFSKKNNP